MAALWGRMLDEFHALGGVAENIIPAQTSFGRGLIPLNPAMPVRLHVPESLLLPLHDVRVEGGEFRVARDASLGAREKSFLETYERDFSWGVGRDQTEKLLQEVQEAPAQIRQLLETPLEAYGWIVGAHPEAVAEQFFAARAVRYKGMQVIAPLADLINHGLGPQFQARNGLALHGRFSGEIVTRYGPTDPLGIFKRWGFVSSRELFAYSLGLELRTSSGWLIISRRDFAFGGNRNPFVPEVSVTGDQITLSHLLLGHKRFPKLARGIFYRLMQEAGRRDSEEIFDRIQHLNRTGFHLLAAALEGAAPPLGRLLRDLARNQLEAMSYNVGASEAMQS